VPIDVRRLFDRAARLYDTAWIQRALYAALQDRALAELQRLRARAVLDVGCGTGIFAARLAEQAVPGRVFGCDLSAGMLAEAQRRSRDVGWMQGDSGRLPVRTGVLDAVVSTQAFHFFDQPAAWREFRRVLLPGGHALVGMVNPKSEAGSRLMARLGAATSTTPVTMPTRPQMRRLAVEAGFDVVAQPEVAWRFARLAPLVLTVGRAYL
jgi:ubiquinone/menaquinone biosynthesis C-methylase UbiE